MKHTFFALLVFAIVFCSWASPPPAGADDEEQLRKISFALHFESVKKAEKMLASQPELARSYTKYGETLLHDVVTCKKPEPIACLMNAGADVNALNKYGETPLFCAVRSNNLTAVKVLLRYHADPEITDKRSDTPLMIAAHRGFVDAMKLLVAAGADVQIPRAESSETALHFAAEWYQAESAAFLVAHEADIDARTAIGRTPLHYAIDISRWQGFTKETAAQIETVNVLLAAGADPFIADITKVTPLALAESFREKTPTIAKAVREAAGKKRNGGEAASEAK